MTRSADVQMFTELGLTLLQAKTYLSLYALRTGSIKTISKSSGIARSDTYRIIRTLQEKGLAARMIGAPAAYRATPIKIAVSTLLQHKTVEHTNLQQKAERWFNSFQEKREENVIVDGEDTEFLIVSEKTLLHRMLDRESKKAQRTLDFAGRWESTRSVFFDLSPELFSNTVDRGIRVRCITEIHKSNETTDRILERLKKPLFQIRYYVPPIPFRTAIYDEKSAIMWLRQTQDDDVSTIWSNNQMFVRVVASYYDELWRNAQKRNLLMTRAH